jgi:uncharacterized protein
MQSNSLYSEGFCMKILVTGSSGLIGSALLPFLKNHGHHVFRLIRENAEKSQDTVIWNPEKGEVNLAELEGFDAVIHLAGENLSSKRWSIQKKKRILDSRVKGTKTLCNILKKLKTPPKILINASAIGFYGDRGDMICTEDSSSGTGFLADVCRQWEAATEPAKQAGIRVVIMRFGVVLSDQGGALKRMAKPFKLGLGGLLGSGKQYISWIAIDDLLEIILFVLNNETLQGPVNAVSPHPTTNYDWTKTLGRVLGRPAFFPLPEFVVRVAFGEMADELFLSSTRVIPYRLLDLGFTFRYPDLEEALKHLLQVEVQK